MNRWHWFMENDLGNKLVISMIIVLFIVILGVSYYGGFIWTSTSEEPYILVEIYNADTNDLAFACIFDKKKRYETWSFAYPLKRISAVSLTVVSELNDSIKEAREIREHDGWDMGVKK